MWIIHIRNADGYSRVPGEYQNKTAVRACIDNLRSRGVAIWTYDKDWVGPRVRVQLKTPENYDIWRGY